MTKLYIMCGLPFSGKTTLSKKIAERTASELVSFDALWKEKESELPEDKTQEWQFVRFAAKERILSFLKEGRSVVYDDINVGLDHRDELRAVAKEAHASAIVVYVNTPTEIRMERMKANLRTQERHDVEETNLVGALEQFVQPIASENVIEYRPDQNLEEWLKTL